MKISRGFTRIYTDKKAKTKTETDWKESRTRGAADRRIIMIDVCNLNAFGRFAGSMFSFCSWSGGFATLHPRLYAGVRSADSGRRTRPFFDVLPGLRFHIWRRRCRE